MGKMMGEDTRKIATRIHMVTGIGRMTNGVNQGGNTPKIQACFAGNEVRDGIPFVQHYGFASMPMAGSDIIATFQSGDRNKGVVIASNDQRYRIKTLKDGEVALYHQSGSSILLKTDGSIEINPSNKKTVIHSDVQINGKVDATGNIETMADVKAGSTSLKSHRHSNGNNGQLTGVPTT